MGYPIGYCEELSMHTPGRIWFLGISMEMHFVWFRGGCNSHDGAFGQRRYHATKVHEESHESLCYFMCSCNKKGGKNWTAQNKMGNSTKMAHVHKLIEGHRWKNYGFDQMIKGHFETASCTVIYSSFLWPKVQCCFSPCKVPDSP